MAVAAAGAVAEEGVVAAGAVVVAAARGGCGKQAFASKQPGPGGNLGLTGSQPSGSKSQSYP